MHNGSLWKIMEILVHHISSSRKPTVAMLSHVVDLNALYPPPLPFPPKWFVWTFFFDPKYLGNPWEFFENFFTVWYPSPSSTKPPAISTKFTSGLGAGAPQKIFFEFKLNELAEYKVPKNLRRDPQWGPFESLQTREKVIDRVQRNWGKTKFDKFTPLKFDPLECPYENFDWDQICRGDGPLTTAEESVRISAPHSRDIGDQKFG